MKFLIGVLVVIASLVQAGVSISCYECTSHAGKTCIDPFTHAHQNTVPKKDCSQDRESGGVKSVCVKAVTKDSTGKTLIHRGCGTPNHCDDLKTRVASSSSELKMCKVCDGNFCNSAPRHLQASIALIVVPLAIVFIFL